MAAVTGRIGSGKSTVSALLAGMGVPVLDLDAVGRALQQRPEIVAGIARAFGPEVVCDGVVDRAALAARCFADRAALRRLEALLHPLIWREAEGWIARQEGVCVVEASALRDRPHLVDVVVGVQAARPLRRRRVAARGGRAAEYFDAIDRLQRPPKADVVIDNNDGMDRLRQEVARLHGRLLRRARRHADRLSGPG